MAQATNLFDIYDQSDNVKESVSKMITMISPQETPFLSSIKQSEKAGSSIHEWLKESLADAADNFHLEGDEFTADGLVAADRLKNTLQISKKQIALSGRAVNSDTFGGHFGIPLLECFCTSCRAIPESGS